MALDSTAQHSSELDWIGSSDCTNGVCGERALDWYSAVRTDSKMGEHGFQFVQGDGAVLVGVVLVEQLTQCLTIHVICRRRDRRTS